MAIGTLTPSVRSASIIMRLNVCSSLQSKYLLGPGSQVRQIRFAGSPVASTKDLVLCSNIFWCTGLCLSGRNARPKWNVRSFSLVTSTPMTAGSSLYASFV